LVIVVDTNIWARAILGDHPGNGCREAITFDALFGRGEKVRRLP
jgi:hypothetical protein